VAAVHVPDRHLGEQVRRRGRRLVPVVDVERVGAGILGKQKAVASAGGGLLESDREIVEVVGGDFGALRIGEAEAQVDVEIVAAGEVGTGERKSSEPTDSEIQARVEFIKARIAERREENRREGIEPPCPLQGTSGRRR
jgi:hypothetical protein